MAKTPAFSLKDQLFNRDRVQYLSQQFADSNASFDASGFVAGVMKELKKLELKERIVHIALTLEEFLDPDFRVSAKQIIAALPPPLDSRLSDDDFGDFIFAPLGEFVVRNGLNRKHLRLSLRTLKQLTKRFSMEDSIRYFINEFPDATLAELDKWTSDNHYHVRRLVSEGTRARLPWSGRLQIEHDRPIKLLDDLHSDKTRYVTRSVANHLNDVARSDPALVLATLRRWKKVKLQDPKELQWMTKHALRTLVKQGNKDALKLLGYRPDPKVEVSDFMLSPAAVHPGQAVEFSFVLTAERTESLMIDYVIDFVKAGGKRAAKVHKIRTAKIAKGESLWLKRRHPFRANATTFTLYPGIHFLSLQINGKRIGRLPFEMKADRG